MTEGTIEERGEGTADAGADWMDMRAEHRIRQIQQVVLKMLSTGHTVDHVAGVLVEAGLAEDLARQVAESGQAAITAHQASPQAQADAMWVYKEKVKAGFAFLVGGTLVTAGTYLVAAPGESYVITIGMLVGGVVYLVEGLGGLSIGLLRVGCSRIGRLFAR